MRKLPTFMVSDDGEEWEKVNDLCLIISSIPNTEDISLNAPASISYENGCEENCLDARWQRQIKSYWRSVLVW